jgi:hypothetical protein
MASSARLQRRPGPAGSRLGKYLNGLGWTDDAGDYFDDGAMPQAIVYDNPAPLSYPMTDFSIVSPELQAPSFWETYGKDIITGVKETGMALLTLQQQKELNEANLQRAQRGLTPLSPQQFAPQVNVGMSADTKKLLIYGGIAAAALYFLTQRA